MRVWELIEKLEAIKDQEKEVVISGDIEYSLNMVTEEYNTEYGDYVKLW